MQVQLTDAGVIPDAGLFLSCALEDRLALILSGLEVVALEEHGRRIGRCGAESDLSLWSSHCQWL